MPNQDRRKLTIVGPDSSSLELRPSQSPSAAVGSFELQPAPPPLVDQPDLSIPRGNLDPTQWPDRPIGPAETAPLANPKIGGPEPIAHVPATMQPELSATPSLEAIPPAPLASPEPITHAALGSEVPLNPPRVAEGISPFPQQPSEVPQEPLQPPISGETTQNPLAPALEAPGVVSPNNSNMAPIGEEGNSPVAAQPLEAIFADPTLAEPSAPPSDVTELNLPLRPSVTEPRAPLPNQAEPELSSPIAPEAVTSETGALQPAAISYLEMDNHISTPDNNDSPSAGDGSSLNEQTSNSNHLSADVNQSVATQPSANEVEEADRSNDLAPKSKPTPFNLLKMLTSGGGADHTDTWSRRSQDRQDQLSA